VKQLLISIGLFSLLAVGSEESCSLRNQGANCTPVAKEAVEPGLKLLPGEMPKTAKKSSGTRKPQSEKETIEKPALRVKAAK
jgi:hypothetical protein